MSPSTVLVYKQLQLEILSYRKWEMVTSCAQDLKL